MIDSTIAWVCGVWPTVKPAGIISAAENVAATAPGELQLTVEWAEPSDMYPGQALGPSDIGYGSLLTSYICL